MPPKQLISISDSFSEKYTLTVNPRVGQNDPQAFLLGKSHFSVTFRPDMLAYVIETMSKAISINGWHNKQYFMPLLRARGGEGKGEGSESHCAQ